MFNHRIELLRLSPMNLICHIADLLSFPLLSPHQLLNITTISPKLFPSLGKSIIKV